MDQRGKIVDEVAGDLAMTCVFPLSTSAPQRPRHPRRRSVLRTCSNVSRSDNRQSFPMSHVWMGVVRKRPGRGPRGSQAGASPSPSGDWGGRHDPCAMLACELCAGVVVIIDSNIHFSFRIVITRQAGDRRAASQRLSTPSIPARSHILIHSHMYDSLTRQASATRHGTQ